MPNPHYSEFREQTSVGPKDTRPAADTTGNSRKGQRGGSSVSSSKTAGASGWTCSTSKNYGTGGKVNSTTKRESGSGWTISSKKGR